MVFSEDCVFGYSESIAVTLMLMLYERPFLSRLLNTVSTSLSTLNVIHCLEAGRHRCPNQLISCSQRIFLDQ